MATRATAVKAQETTASAASNVSPNGSYQYKRELTIEFISKLIFSLFVNFGDAFAAAKTAVGFDEIDFWLSQDVKKTVYKAAATEVAGGKRNKLVGAGIRLCQPLIDLGIRSMKQWKQTLKTFNQSTDSMTEQAYAFTGCTSFVQSIMSAVALPDGVTYHKLQSKIVACFKPGDGQTVKAKEGALALAIGQDLASADQVIAAEKSLAKFRATWQAAIAQLPEGATKAQKDAVKPALIPFNELAQNPTVTPTV